MKLPRREACEVHEADRRNRNVRIDQRYELLPVRLRMACADDVARGWLCGSRSPTFTGWAVIDAGYTPRSFPAYSIRRMAIDPAKNQQKRLPTAKYTDIRAPEEPGRSSRTLTAATANNNMPPKIRYPTGTITLSSCNLEIDVIRGCRRKNKPGNVSCGHLPQRNSRRNSNID